jgi:DNA mismatch repair ATPase MutS
MKTFLMHENDCDLKKTFPVNEQALMKNLELNALFNAMSLGDQFLYEAVKQMVLSGLNNDLNTILYRQNILKDCLKNSSIIRDMYALTVETIEKKKKSWYGIFTHQHPSSILYNMVGMMHIYVSMIKKLRNVSDEHADKFESDGFTALFQLLKNEINDEYLISIQNHLKELKFHNGILISAELGKGNKGVNYILRKSKDKKQSWIKQFFAKIPNGYTFSISERDESGTRALSELKDRGINSVANALAQSVDHILGFFNRLRTELAFYVGCLNLHGQLEQMKAPISFPLPGDSSERRHSFQGLYDVCLALTLKKKIVGNDVNADNKCLVIITGANQGGKSTFLRSIGLAQLMMQCGMFVPADSFSSNICDSLFTHYKREEDASMVSGKLDEELGRMSDIIDNITQNSMLLLNESFAATNKREGSEISRQIISALLEKRIKVFFVTHGYDFAYDLYERKLENATFLRAERQSDGERTFKIIKGEPLQTSYGEDLYNRIFGSV